jgi:hypothetical protein
MIISTGNVNQVWTTSNAVAPGTGCEQYKQEILYPAAGTNITATVPANPDYGGYTFPFRYCSGIAFDGQTSRSIQVELTMCLRAQENHSCTADPHRRHGCVRPGQRESD